LLRLFKHDETRRDDFQLAKWTVFNAARLRKQGGTAEAVIGTVIETIDSTINYSFFFITK
jgi:hypothetical protein